MNIQQIFYNSAYGREIFEMTEGKRPWDIFLIISKGSFEYTVDGNTFDIKENEIAYFPANTYFTRAITSPITFHQLRFHTDRNNKYYKYLKAGKLNIPAETVAEMIKSMDITARLSEEREIFPHMIENIILQHYLRCKKEQATPQGYSSDILYVIRYMDDHLSEKISIEKLAEQVYLSHVGLIWKFKQQLGTSPSQYLIMLRMQYAKQLLLDGDLRIGEISERCGYSRAPERGWGSCRRSGCTGPQDACSRCTDGYHRSSDPCSAQRK